MSGEPYDVCEETHALSGARCNKPAGPHRAHSGYDPRGTFRMWEDYQGQRGPKKFPRVGDNINDFPEYK